MHKRVNKPDLVDDKLGRRIKELSRVVGMTPRDLVQKAVEEFADSRKRRNGKGARTELGGRLRSIRAKIARGGAPQLDAKGIEREVVERRGERGI